MTSCGYARVSTDGQSLESQVGCNSRRLIEQCPGHLGCPYRGTGECRGRHPRKPICDTKRQQGCGIGAHADIRPHHSNCAYWSGRTASDRFACTRHHVGSLGDCYSGAGAGSGGRASRRCARRSFGLLSAGFGSQSGTNGRGSEVFESQRICDRCVRRSRLPQPRTISHLSFSRGSFGRKAGSTLAPSDR